MAWRPTGPGKFHVHSQQANGVTLRLYNFDHDGVQLKREHTAALQSRVAPLLIGNRSMRANVFGYASTSGNTGYNQGLSQRRIDTVMEYLIAKGGTLSQFMSRIPHGESQADQQSPDAEWDRAVMIDVAMQPTPNQVVRPEPDRSAPPTAFSTRFSYWKIRQVDTLNLAAAAVYYFEIASVDRPQVSQIYKLVGVGVSEGFDIPWSSSAGPWNYFNTSRLCHVWEFTSGAIYGQVASGSGVGTLSLFTLERVGTAGGAIHIRNFRIPSSDSVSASLVTGSFYIPAPRAASERGFRIIEYVPGPNDV